MEKLMILAVDDNARYLRSLEFMLKRMGHTVTSVQAPRTAISMYEQAKFDVVFLDFRMPEMNGFELAKELFQRGARRIIMLSSEDHLPEQLEKLVNVILNKTTARGKVLETALEKIMVDQ